MTATASTDPDPYRPLTIALTCHGDRIVDVAVSWPGTRPYASCSAIERDGQWIVHKFGHSDPSTPCYRYANSRDSAVAMAVRLAEVDGRMLMRELASVPAAGV